MKKVFIYGDRDNLKNYVEAVEFSGAKAICSFDVNDSLDCDALLLSGGADINPKLYGQENTASVGIDDTRDTAEFALTKIFYEADKPILGICRGHQLLNVYFGGQLCQHINNAERHSRKADEDDKVHGVTVKKGSFLYELYGEKFSVNSSHHQGNEPVAEFFDTIAYSDDGIVEGMENKEHNIISTQFHPERMSFNHKRDDTVDGKYIFNYFLNLCK
jgi:putative glutamine amidotransferase